jgi:hypothetical protein
MTLLYFLFGYDVPVAGEPPRWLETFCVIQSAVEWVGVWVLLIKLKVWEEF